MALREVLLQSRQCVHPPELLARGSSGQNLQCQRWSDWGVVVVQAYPCRSALWKARSLSLNQQLHYWRALPLIIWLTLSKCTFLLGLCGRLPIIEPFASPSSKENSMVVGPSVFVLYKPGNLYLLLSDIALLYPFSNLVWKLIF